MKKIIVYLGLVVSVSFTVNADNVIFLDDFQNGIVGSPPVGPQIGSYDQYSGNHIVTDLGGGNLALRSVDNLETSGFVIVCKPVLQPIKSNIEYDILIEQNPTTNLVGLNAFNQQLILSPLGDNITLLWGNDHKTYLRTSIDGASSDAVDLGYSWSFDTFYHVDWNVDAVVDRFSLTINNNVLCSDLALGDDFSALLRLASAWSNYPTTGNQLIDNVQIIEIPEPATLSLLALGAFFAGRRRRN